MNGPAERQTVKQHALLALEATVGLLSRRRLRCLPRGGLSRPCRGLGRRGQGSTRLSRLWKEQMRWKGGRITVLVAVVNDAKGRGLGRSDVLLVHGRCERAALLGS